MEYQEYLEKFWLYLPYIIYAYVFLTFLPKSLKKIQQFANANYEENRYKYHRCYGTEFCCHTLAINNVTPVKPKTRKPITRIYPKRKLTTPTVDSGYGTSSDHSVTRRPVQTYTHVNQIARMFENGTTTNTTNIVTKKINRVSPTILPADKKPPIPKITTPPTTHHKSRLTKRQSSAEDFAKMLLAENLLSLEDIEMLQNNDHDHDDYDDGFDHQQKQHNQWSRGRAGTSATPSTASPAASCSPISISPTPSPRQLSPVTPLLTRVKSSLDDIFAAIANNAENQTENHYICSANVAATLSPVTSIDDILAQRRLSRPLSAYSISDLLLDEQHEQFILNKTINNNITPIIYSNENS